MHICVYIRKSRNDSYDTDCDIQLYRRKNDHTFSISQHKIEKKMSSVLSNSLMLAPPLKLKLLLYCTLLTKHYKIKYFSWCTFVLLLLYYHWLERKHTVCRKSTAKHKQLYKKNLLLKMMYTNLLHTLVTLQSAAHLVQ